MTYVPVKLVKAVFELFKKRQSYHQTKSAKAFQSYTFAKKIFAFIYFNFVKAYLNYVSMFRSTLQQLFEILLQEFNQTIPSALPMNGVSENQASEDDSNH